MAVLWENYEYMENVPWTIMGYFETSMLSNVKKVVFVPFSIGIQTFEGENLLLPELIVITKLF